MSIAMDSRRKDLALLIYGSLNFDARGRIKLSPSVSIDGIISTGWTDPIIMSKWNILFHSKDCFYSYLPKHLKK